MTNRVEHKRTKVHYPRVGVQVVCLALFVFLALAARFQWKSALPYDLFLRFDPVVWLMVSAAARTAALYGLSVLVLIAVTLLLGRVFCGWVCPLGTVQEAARLAWGRKPGASFVARLSSVRYWVLLALIGAAVTGVNLAGWFDPLVLSGRALRLGPDMPAAIAWTVVCVVFALVLLAPRFWCRTLCPLGAVLALVAYLTPYRRRVGASCKECDACATACPMGQSRIKNSPTECIGCRRCKATCPEQALTFMPDINAVRRLRSAECGQALNPWRRRLVLGLGSFTVGGLGRFMGRAQADHRPLRPPGVLNEEHLLARCVGCGTCIAVCPTGGLGPLVSTRQPAALFTPRLDPRVGPCLPDCTACGDACPTGAIASVPANKKNNTKMGLAVIDRARCLPWTGAGRCVICLDACPPEYDAIELRPIGTGEYRPYVKERLCTGCGICVHKCPVEGEPAIRVVASSTNTVTSAPVKKPLEASVVFKGSILLTFLVGLTCCGNVAGEDQDVQSIRQQNVRRSGSSNMITLFVCGDVMTGRGIDQVLPHPSHPVLYEPYVRTATRYVELAERVNGPIPNPVSFAYPWGEALEALEQVNPDLRIINLETSVTTSNEHWPGKGIHYRMHPKNVACLIEADIDCCALANNHVLDWGYRGLSETLETLRHVNISTAGAGQDIKEAQTPAVLEVEGKGRVIVFSYGLQSSGIPHSWTAAKGKPGVCLLKSLSDRTIRQIKEQVEAIKQQGDIVVVSIHWGGNWGYQIPAEQRELAHRLIDHADVDLVHGHSSHHVKGIAVHKDRPIIYGCGDFLNDYEGISGYENFRADLALMYLVSMDPSTGKLIRLDMIPMQIRRFRMNRVSRADALWLRDVLNREGKQLGTRVAIDQDNTLTLEWD